MELLENIGCDYTINTLRWGYLNKKFSESFVLGVQHDIAFLLKEKIKKYCNGYSTSVTVEVGEQLLKAIYYIIDINFVDDFYIEDAVDLFKENSIKQLYKEGKKKLEDLFYKTKSLYNNVCYNKYDTELIAYNNTLIEEFSKFFDVYNIEFNPQSVDISVDYPLIFVDENQKGILYIKKYLETIDIENRFCNLFDNKKIELLLDINARKYKLNYKDVLTNIFQIVINNVVLSIIINGKLEDFYIYSEEINYLKSNLNLDNVEKEIDEAVYKMIKYLNINDINLLEYINSYIYIFKNEIKSALVKNSLETIVVICDEDLDTSSNKEFFTIEENRIEDKEFRQVLEEIRKEADINKKIKIIRNKINSVEDFNDILKGDYFYKKEYNVLFNSLSDFELAFLLKTIFYEDIEMGKFNLLNEIFKDNKYYYDWQKNYIEYIKNQTIDRIVKIQNKAIDIKL